MTEGPPTVLDCCHSDLEGPMANDVASRVILRISVAALAVAFCHLVYQYVVFSEVTIQFSWF